jgi:hypothetical protein
LTLGIVNTALGYSSGNRWVAPLSSHYRPTKWECLGRTPHFQDQIGQVLLTIHKISEYIESNQAISKSDAHSHNTLPSCR